MKHPILQAISAVALLVLSVALPLRATAQDTNAQGAEKTVAEPTVSGLAPLSVVAGGPAFKLTVKGAGFTNTATVYWNETDLPTTVVSTTELTVIVPGALRKNEGYAAITVHQGDAITAQVALAIHAPGPILRSIQPASVKVNVGSVPLILTGANFTAKSVLLCNGKPLTTAFVSAKELHATLPAADTAMTGFLRIQVRQNGAISKGLAVVVGTPKASPQAAKRLP